jgi:hypothetical protein
MDALSHRGTVVQPDKRSPLAVGRGSGLAYVGFVMVVAVSRWARGAPARGRGGLQSVLHPLFSVCGCLAGSLTTTSSSYCLHDADWYVF